MFRKSVVIVFLLLAVALPFALGQDAELPDVILAQRPNFGPEGIEWDAEGGRFLTGSLPEGSIFAIADDGTVTPFIEDEDLVATIGIHIDHETGRLLVCNSDTVVFSDQEAPGIAQLGIYDLATGERLHLADLGGLLPPENRHFCNDVTVDTEGNAYVTDSLSPVVYQVTPDGEASVFVEDERLLGEGFGANGIDFHPDGYLLVALGGAGEAAGLLKIPVDDPSALTPVELSEPFAADGMVFTPDGSLIAVATTFNEDETTKSELLHVASEDDWATAGIIQRAPLDASISPTTVALRDGVPYVVHAHFNEIFSGEPVDAFEIMPVEFAGAM